MRPILMLLLSFSCLYGQQFIVQISGLPDSAGIYLNYDAEGLVGYKKGISIDPDIRISDTTKTNLDPGIIGKVFPKQPKINVIVYVLARDANGKSVMRPGSPDEMLKYSSINSRCRIPGKNGYFLFVNNKWEPYVHP